MKATSCGALATGANYSLLGSQSHCMQAILAPLYPEFLAFEALGSTATDEVARLRVSTKSR